MMEGSGVLGLVKSGAEPWSECFWISSTLERWKAGRSTAKSNESVEAVAAEAAFSGARRK